MIGSRHVPGRHGPWHENGDCKKSLDLLQMTLQLSLRRRAPYRPVPGLPRRLVEDPSSTCPKEAMEVYYTGPGPGGGE